MVALMAGIAIAMILSSVAAQKWSDVVRRDNEAEMMFRAQDLVRAIKRYQKDQGHLPMQWKDLMEPGQKGQYFARKLWKDPLVKNGKWQTLYASPQGALIDPTAPGVDPSLGPGLGSGSSSPFASPSPTATSPTGLANQNASPTGRAIGVADVKHNDDGTAEIAGLPIAGVKSRCKDRPFRVYKEKDEYSQWLFSIYDLQTPKGGAAVGTAPKGSGAGAPRVPSPGK